MINITNDIAKRRLLTELTLLQQNIEISFAKEVGKILRKQFWKAGELVKNYRMLEVYSALDSERQNFINVFRKFYRRTAKIFYDRFFEDANKSFMFYETKGILEEFWRELERYIGTTALSKVQVIDNATRRMFRVIINKGMGEGKSDVEIAKDLKKTGIIQKTWRAKRIARTETHSTAIHSLHESARASRMIQEKEWLSARDDRTRTSPFNHVIANGERVDIKEYFQKTGESLMYPGDSIGSAGNIINCRCVELFHTNYRVEEAV